MFRPFVLILGWLCVALPALANPSLVWFSSNESLYRVDGTSNIVVQTLPLKDIGQLAVDSQGAVWAVTDKQLLKVGADGAILIQSDFQTLGLQSKPAIAVDPYDDSLWLADTSDVLLANATGQRLGSFPASFAYIRQVKVGLDQSLWLLGNKRLTHYSATGGSLATLDLHPVANAEPKVFVVDDLGGVIWLAGENELVQIDLGARQALQRIVLPEVVQGLALQPKTGTVWALSKQRLLAYDINGSLRHDISLPGLAISRPDIDLADLAIRRASSLVFDPANDSIWVTHQSGVARFSTAGEFLAQIASPQRAEEIAATPFTLLPRVSLLEPRDGLSTNNPVPTFVLQYDATCNGEPCGLAGGDLPGYTLVARLSGIDVSQFFAFNLLAGTATYTPASRLPEGMNTFSAQARDSFGHLSNVVTSAITIDTIAPAITVVSPANGTLTNQVVQTIEGSISEPGTLTINSQGVSFAPDNSFTKSVTLQEGLNTISLAVTDPAGNTASRSLSVTVDTTPPAGIATTQLSVGTATASGVTITGAAGSVEAGSRVRITNLRTGETVEVLANAAGAFSAQIAAAPGDQFQVTVVDPAGNASPPATVAVPGGTPIPPDPATVATPIDPTVPTQLAASTAFLYTGPNAIQTGVAPGTIEPRRAAVLRGKVLMRDNQPLAGVTITVLRHPEFGETRSRADGMFDMAANGGGYLTINYSKAGYLPVQRTINAPWQDYVMAPDVVIVPLDARATTIDLTAATAMQVARGSLVSDQDGTRQATLLFPQGTTATMVLPDGTTQALTSITMRATEYTVGPNGPNAMPGPLPPTSGYTYAAEYSVDEALAAGATTVRFNQPVYQYVENFLNFPVGGIVPVGYYDRQKAAWIPSDNGRIIKILSIAGGIAELDTNGDGLVDDAARLAALNITDNERTRLAMLYAPGTSLWRVPITHFTPWDYNWPYGPPDGADAPKVPDPAEDRPLDDPDSKCGSIIECQNQSLGESVPISGTRFSLNYKSSRMPGRVSNSVLIPLSGPTLPPGVKRIELEVALAGRFFAQSFAAASNQSFTFAWDGLDAYGRVLQGAQPTSIRVGYVYEAVYRTPAELARSFASSGSGAFSGDSARGEVTLWKYSQVTLGTWQVPVAVLGGWTLDVHHSYDPNGQTIYLGDGRTRSARSMSSVSTVAGNGGYIFSGDGGPATTAGLSEPQGFAADAQGNLYIADTNHSRIRKVTPNGLITTAAGNGDVGFAGDGGPATAAKLGYPFKVAIDAQGSLYVADTYNSRIRKVTPDGTITTVAGNGGYSFSGDGGPATAAAIGFPIGLTVDAQGNLYFSDGYRVRKVTLDGTIITVAGNGLLGFSGDGGPATQAKLDYPAELAVDAQGNLYIADSGNHRIRKVTPDGIITTVAGSGGTGGGFSGDGGSATAAGLNGPMGLAVDAQGSLYIADSDNNRVRKVTPDGTITSVAGNGSNLFSGDGGRATAAGLGGWLTGLAIDPQGALYVGQDGYNRVRRFQRLFPTLDESGLIIASEDGAQLYLFDSSGRHLRTLSTATGAEQYRFTYYANGSLTQIADGDGNLTRIERDPAGNPSAIVAPDGQRTILTLDANGYLGSITNPANETTRMDYGVGGLLTTFTNPRMQSSSMTYDAADRLTKDQNAAGGFWELARTDLSTASHEVSMSTALGRVSRFELEKLSTSDTRRTNTRPDGSVTVTLQKTDGTTQTIAANGTITTTIDGPDPRFGMQAPIVSSTTIKLPSSLTRSVTTTRQTTLSNPTDLLSLITQTDTETINGKVFRSVYNAGLRQYTITSPLNRQTIVRTDVQGRPLTKQVTGIQSVNYEYDARGRLAFVRQGSGTEARSVQYGYNVEGYVDSVTDALERSTRYTYDAAGRVKTITLPDTRVISVDYDPNGNVTFVTPPSRPAHRFEYSPVDLVTDYAPPALGSQPVATHYEYNLDKQPTKAIRPDGQIIDYGYDLGGRLASLTTPTGVISYGYTPTSGQLATLTAPGGIGLAFSYDGALPTGTHFTGPVAGNISTAYDNFFRVSQVGVNGSNITYGYDADGLLTSAGSLTLTRDLSNGLVTGSTLGQIVTSQRYNSLGEPAGFTAKQGATVLFDEQYTRDAVGRLIQKLVTVGGQSNLYTYDYDPAGRLTDVSRDGVAIGHFEYDANGNRTLANGISATYDDQDRLTDFGGAQYSYTANGELQQIVTGASVTAYEYDVFGNLVRADLSDGSTLGYVADGRQRRIGKKVNGTLVQGFLYQDQLKPAAELDAQGNVVSRFVYASKINVPEYMVKSGVAYRMVTDPLGSVRLVVDSATGQVAQRIDYDEWGNVLQDTNPGFQPFGFAGGLYDRHTGLVRFGARDYDPKTGRWTAKDPIGFAGGDANLYSYVLGNPLTYTDPLGLDPWGRENPDPWYPRDSKPPFQCRPDGQPWGWGCGDKDTDHRVPDVVGGVSMIPACRKHDECYNNASKPGASKARCDQQFKADIYSLCRQAGRGNYYCRSLSYSYFKGVDIGGGDAWSAAKAQKP